MTVITDQTTFASFAVAGRATFTVTSKRTGTSFTFRMRKAKDKDHRWFLDLLTGPNNEADFRYIGTYGVLGRWIDGLSFRAGREVREDAPSTKAAAFVCEVLSGHFEEGIPAGIEVRHEGRCGRCARKLTTPESIDRGIGPECAGKL